MVMHLVAALLVALGSAGATPLPASPARLRVVYDGSTLDGTCVLIDVEPRSDQTALSFVTSLRLFKSPEGDPFSPLREVRVTLDDGRVIVVPRDGVVLPMGNLVDVALLRAAVPAGSFTPIPLAWAPPAIASAFEIAGYDGAGNPATITAHVRFASTRLLVGDRDISGLAGCIGAPAIGLDGLYGIVSECEPNRAPVITRLSMAYSFLARNLPGLQPRPTLKEQP